MSASDTTTSSPIESSDEITLKDIPRSISSDALELVTGQSKPKVHTIMSVIEWKTEYNDKKKITTGDFNIGCSEFCFEIYPNGLSNHNYFKSSLCVFLKYKNKKTNEWSICLNGTMTILCHKIFGEAAKQIIGFDNKYINSSYGNLIVGNKKAKDMVIKKMVILLNYELLDVWNNEIPIECDNPDCNKIICFPNKLSCGHVFCEMDKCKDIKDKCPLCYKEPKCICPECSS